MSANLQLAAASFVERLARDLNRGELELPAFPDAVIRIQQTMQDADKDIDDIIEILSSDPAMAAALLKASNSAAINASGNEITSLRMAIVRLGYKLVSSITTSFAMRQIAMQDQYSDEQRKMLRQHWEDSIDVASISYVLARELTDIKGDEAMLAGLLHVIGKLYIFMQANDDNCDLTPEEIEEIGGDWHPTIAKAIVESWGLPESLQTAMEEQDEYGTPPRGSMTLSDVLISARVMSASKRSDEPAPTAAQVPSLQRIGLVSKDDEPASIDRYEELIRLVRQTLTG